MFRADGSTGSDGRAMQAAIVERFALQDAARMAMLDRMIADGRGNEDPRPKPQRAKPRKSGRLCAACGEVPLAVQNRSGVCSACQAKAGRFCVLCKTQRLRSDNRSGACQKCRTGREGSPLTPETSTAMSDRTCRCGCGRYLRKDNESGWAGACNARRYAAGDRPPRPSRARRAA